jgi:uncharacterized protein
MIPVIDMWAPVVPSREIIQHMAADFPGEQLQYLEVFQRRRVSAEEFSAIAPSWARPDEAILADLDAAGIRRSLVSGFDEKSTCGHTFVTNESIAALVDRNPDRFIPFAGVDVMGGAETVRSLRSWVEDRGFRGLSLRPFMVGEPASHRAYWPLYSACVELHVPVSIHTSANWTRTRWSDLGHPRHLDEVACAFPDLTIIASHGGYPWVLEACLLARKHPNFYLELGAHRPRYFGTPGAGWEPLLRLGSTTIADKVLYGTGAFLLGRAYSELVSEMTALPLPQAVLERWLWRNAANLLSLGVTAAGEAGSPVSTIVDDHTDRA